ncbi:hypothetical protein BKA82DRAFT_4013174 [Pisolithus tinctorius]|nr:hypothetical protein BKA82DRAFT_4013174 [Pisolithus tinctorius]
MGRCIVERQASRDDVSVLDIVQRHHDALFYLGDVIDDRDVLDVLDNLGTTCILHIASLQRGVRDPSVYYKVDVEGTRAVIDAAVTASILLFPEKPFGACNEAQEVFRPGGHQVDDGLYRAYRCSQAHVQTGDNNNLFDCTYVENIAHAHGLTGNKLVPPPSYSPTMSSEPKLDPKHAMRKLNESLHRVLPPMCATTEYHHTIHGSMWTLSPYVTPAPNAESILSAFNTPFDSHELEHPFAHSRIEGQAFCIKSGGLIYCWDVTGVYDGNE